MKRAAYHQLSPSSICKFLISQMLIFKGLTGSRCNRYNMRCMKNFYCSRREFFRVSKVVARTLGFLKNNVSTARNVCC